MHDLLLPVFTAWGLPAVTADVVAFVVALVVVTFVHLVIGEMAPKSWAIAHPERSAILLALPMRAFMAVTRPLLVALNALANVCLRRVGVEPVDELAAGHNPDDLRELVAHSAETGTLDRERHDRLVTALDLEAATLGSLVRPHTAVSTVAPTRAPTRSGRSPAVPGTCGWWCATASSSSGWCTSATRWPPRPRRGPAASCGRC